METFVDSVKVMDQWQITIPADVRKALRIARGDHVSFVVEGNSVRLENTTRNSSEKSRGKIAVNAIQKAQAAFDGAAVELGLMGEDDVQALVDQVRHGARG